MAWLGNRLYVGAEWTVASGTFGNAVTLTWTEITVTNPFPSTVVFVIAFRDAAGNLDGRFFTRQALPPLAQAWVLVRDLTLPNSSSGWFLLASTPTPVVPSAVIYWSLGMPNVAVTNVTIQQLDWDGFPIGDSAAQPPPPEPIAKLPIESLRRPPMSDLWAERIFGEEHARESLELFRAAQSGSLDAVERLTHTVGLLVDDEAREFRSRFGEPG